MGDEFKNWTTQTHVRIAEYFYIETETRKLLHLANGHIGFEDDLAPDIAAQVKADESLVSDTREVQVKKIKWCKLTGKEILEELTGIPVVGIIPWFKDIYIDDEDSVVIDSKQQQSHKDKVNIAVVLLKHISNFTDFNALEHDERVHLFYTNQPIEIGRAHV